MVVLVPGDIRQRAKSFEAMFTRVGAHLHVYRYHVLVHVPDLGKLLPADVALLFVRLELVVFWGGEGWRGAW